MVPCSLHDVASHRNYNLFKLKFLFASIIWSRTGWGGCLNWKLLWCKLFLDGTFLRWWRVLQHSMHLICLHLHCVLIGSNVFMKMVGWVHHLDRNRVIGSSCRSCVKARHTNQLGNLSVTNNILVWQNNLRRKHQAGKKMLYYLLTLYL